MALLFPACLEVGVDGAHRGSSNGLSGLSGVGAGFLTLRRPKLEAREPFGSRRFGPLLGLLDRPRSLTRRGS